MRYAVEERTGRLFGDLWHRYDDEQFEQSVELFGARWRANGEDEDFFRGKDCLDAGCGGGRFTLAMAQMGAASVTGVDVSGEGVAEAERRRQAMGMLQVHFRQASLLDLPFPDASFDFVCCSGVLHHTVSIERSLSEIHRVLSPGGSVYLLVYGAGGLYWPLNLVMRSFAQHLGADEVDRCIGAAGLPANKRRTILDDLFVPILETYSWDRVEALLRHAGFEKWRRWKAGQFDHESSADALVAELRLRTALWNAGAASAGLDAADVERHLALICEHVVGAAMSLLGQHKRGRISADALRAAVIGDGHHRLVATRG